MTMISAYLAGPDVFLPNPIAQADLKKAICLQHGIKGVFPLDAVLNLDGLSKNEAGRKIGAANRQLIQSCDIVIANITPFRGPSADVGTVFEIGYACGLGKDVYVYSNDSEPFSQRTREWVDGAFYQDTTVIVDNFGMSIEDFDMVDNLMIPEAVKCVTVGRVPYDEYYTSLKVFETCLERIAEDLSSNTDSSV